MVVMNDQINAARDVTKTNTSQVETFRSLEFGALGVVDVEAVRFYRSPLRRQTLTADSRTALRRVRGTSVDRRHDWIGCGCPGAECVEPHSGAGSLNVK